MENTNSNREADKNLRVIAVVTLAILCLSLLWLFYDLYAYSRIRAISPESVTIVAVTGIGFLVRILLFLFFAVLILRSFRQGLKPSLTVIISIITGSIAIIAMFFDFAALEDIGTDYLEYGYKCTGEWIWLFGSLLLRLVFYTSLFALIIRILKSNGTLNPSSQGLVDEILFEVTQWVGIISGGTGVIFTMYAFTVLDGFTAKSWLLWLLLFYCGAIMLPWLALTVYRISRLALRREPSPYDEKQKQDMSFAGMTAWLVSVPLMAIMLVFSLGKSPSPVVYLWFPFYLFTTLLVYSVVLLKRYRKG